LKKIVTDGREKKDIKIPTKYIKGKTGNRHYQEKAKSLWENNYKILETKNIQFLNTYVNTKVGKKTGKIIST
jgi:hypothetical protein